MKSIKLRHLINASIVIAALGLFAGCAAQSASSGTEASSAVLSLTPSTTTVALSAQVEINVTGGTAPYTFQVISGLGNVYANGTSGIYTAPASGSGLVEIQVTDSNQAVAVTGLTLSGTTLVLTPQNQTIGTGASVSMAVSGGTGPYYFNVGTSGGGTFSITGATTGSNTFTAGSTSESVLVTVTDSASPANTASTYVYVSAAASSSTTSCSGNYTITENGTAGSMTIGTVSSSTQSIAGSITLNNGTYQSFTGTCTGTSITFVLNGNATFTGTIDELANNIGHVIIIGSYTTSGGTYSWMASN